MTPQVFMMSLDISRIMLALSVTEDSHWKALVMSQCLADPVHQEASKDVLEQK